MDELFRDRKYFFDDGILFSCRRCGACCTGESGTVFVEPHEAARIAHALGLTAGQLTSRHMHAFRGGYSIREDNGGRCVFFSPGIGCAIYEVRPWQCRSFPFWIRTMRSERAWRHAATQCPGIGSGRWHGREEILDLLGRSVNL